MMLLTKVGSDVTEKVSTQLKIQTVMGTPYDDYAMGTSGDRKQYSLMMREHYCEQEFQAIADWANQIHDSSENIAVICADGREGSLEKVKNATRILVANGFKVIVHHGNGISTTPSASFMVRKYKARLAIILTASHNPGGKNQKAGEKLSTGKILEKAREGDFGIKVNTSNGAAALPQVTNAVVSNAKAIRGYKMADYNEALRHGLIIEKDFAKEYAEHVLDRYDLEALKKLAQSGFRIAVDYNFGSSIDTVKDLLENRIGFKNIRHINDRHLPDFGGKDHPNPEAEFSPELMQAVESDNYDIGFAYDPDADRLMVVLKGGFVVSASDLGAVLTNNAEAAFNGRTITGVGNSMPTSSALKLVAERKGIKFYWTPTGWKFFSTLMDAGMIQYAQEESRGHGQNDIREKSGPDTTMTVLQTIAKTGRGFQDLNVDLWKTDGRVHYLRHDYEKIPKEEAKRIENLLNEKIKEYQRGGMLFDFKVIKSEVYKYTDPTNGEVADNQGWIFHGENNARLIFRFSGTDTTATMRVYAEKPDDWKLKSEDVLNSFFDAAERLTGQHLGPH